MVKAKSATRHAKRMNMQPESSLLSLTHVVNGSNILHAQIGLHPDFKHLKGTDNVEYHNITSVFIDIKGSTNLNDSYDLETIYTITNTVQSAAIHVCLMFGGHIQRLQGDGVFAYFGGKHVEKAEAVRQAVTATAMFTYFIQNDLQQIFEEEGVENICTRTGIDFGDDDDVLWANFGVGGCSELTTNSLHTSLAPKMQSYASKNGIVVGQNVKDKLMTDEKYFDLVRDSKGEIIKRYIYEGRKRNLYYTQYRFDWFNFLKTLPYIKSDVEGNLYVVSQEEQEQDRLARLRSTSLLINTGQACTDKTGNISSNNSGVKNQDHRFHYE
jgi:adenylate cyclase